jgi:hypothetical protein
MADRIRIIRSPIRVFGEASLVLHKWINDATGFAKAFGYQLRRADSKSRIDLLAMLGAEMRYLHKLGCLRPDR